MSVFAMNKDVTIKFTHPIDDSKFLLYKLNECPDSYLKSVERDEFFEMIWFWPQQDQISHSDQNASSIYLIPPFRALDISINDKDGYLIAFKREYLEEDDKEYALDVFNLFNLQGQHSLIIVDSDTQENLQHLYALMAYELKTPLGTYLVLKALLKVFLLHLIRINQSAFLNQDVNQKRVYEFCMLLDKYYIPQRKAAFYADQIGISEKRLNQILQEKMGKTITQLIHARLILEAKRKLTTGELTIKEISYYLNFEDHSYFSRFFRKQAGLSPEDFKKK
jgi:AraC family transcriptional activator of pobA